MQTHTTPTKNIFFANSNRNYQKCKHLKFSSLNKDTRKLDHYCCNWNELKKNNWRRFIERFTRLCKRLKNSI